MDNATGDTGPLMEEDVALATRAAWLYHAGGLTQSEVAAKLGVTNAKAHRLIARANRAGLIRVIVEGPIGSCIAAEAALCQRYGLTTCRVVPNIEDQALPVRALGIAAATFLHDRLEQGRDRVIGLGHGRTLAAAIGFLPRVAATEVTLVSLLGGLPRRIHANPFEVVDHLANKIGADGYLMPVPMFARAAADRDVLRRQSGVAEAMALAGRASLLMLGVGEATADAFLALAGAVTPAELRQARAAGAEGEMLGYFFGSDGRLVDTDLHDRVVGLPLSALPPREPPGRRDVVAVAGGVGKAQAINAVLQSGLLNGLITDELTARQLVAAHP